jgi:hypothetical protein
MTDLKSTGEYKDKELAELKIGPYPGIGGMLFKDCMRWTIIAPRLDLAPKVFI